MLANNYNFMKLTLITQLLSHRYNILNNNNTNILQTL